MNNWETYVKKERYRTKDMEIENREIKIKKEICVRISEEERQRDKRENEIETQSE